MLINGNITGNVGMYLRLSREDGDKLESDSIRNQRELITDFISKNKRMKFVKEYVDDGYSGTNFNRPSFQNMLADAQKGKINCIVVKDLSRFGRNYIETGRYLERIFPSMGIRLIAINDNYDSADNTTDENTIIVPFKNLINDAYCRDISIKIRSHFDVKRKSGQFIGSFACYGYKKDPKNKNHLVIDEYAAGVVEKIFDWKLSGMSNVRIADKLDRLGIQPPYEYKRQNGLNFDCGFRSADSPKWAVDTVLRILKNEEYLGRVVQGKNRKINYKVKKSVPVEKDSWIRVDGMHDAIITKEKFDAVQELLKIDTRTPPKAEEVLPLCGYVICGDCGQNMIRRNTVVKGKEYFYYHCSTYKNGGNCFSHNISCDKVIKAVVKAIQVQIELLDKIQPVLDMIEDYPKEMICVKAIDKQLEKLKQEIEYFGVLKAKLYKDMVDGIVTKKEYPELHDRFDRNRGETEQIYNELEEKKKRILSGQIKYQPWIEEIKRYRNVTVLSRPMVITLLDKVVINSSKEIEVHFLFEDEMTEMMNYVEMQNESKEEERRKAI